MTGATFAACGDRNIQEIAKTPKPTQEEALKIDVLVVKLLNNDNQQERELDHKCSFELKVGDKDEYRIPLENSNLTIDFALDVTKSPDGKLFLGGLEVDSEMYFGVLAENTDTVFPLGLLIPLGDDKLFLAPYVQSEQFRRTPCPKNQTT